MKKNQTRIIVAGSRNLKISWKNLHLLNDELIKNFPNIDTIVCGGAKGADRLGNIWAKLNDVPVMSFNAEWETFGKSAGPIRNQKMAEFATALVLLWDGKSRGSSNMLKNAQKNKLLIIEPELLPEDFK